MTREEFKKRKMGLIGFDYEDEEECLKAVKWNGENIAYIPNPSEELCLSAVREDGLAIQFINNPSEEVCLAAVKQDGLSLLHIRNQTPEICNAAIRQNEDAIRYVRINPELLDKEKEIDKMPNEKLFAFELQQVLSNNNFRKIANYNGKLLIQSRDKYYVIDIFEYNAHSNDLSFDDVANVWVNQNSNIDPKTKMYIDMC